MKQLQIETLTNDFDAIKRRNGDDYWMASELMAKIGYSSREEFKAALQRAREACKNNSVDETTNFVKISTDSGDDYKLSRYAAYLVAINGDPKKEEVAFAQAYFITKTRNLELLEQRIQEMERLDNRKKFTLTEKAFDSILNERGIRGAEFGIVKNEGDKALFGGHTTQEMKSRLGSPNKPLPDVLDSVLLQAKSFAASLTTSAIKSKGLRGLNPITDEHKNTNKGVRTLLQKSGITPEEMPPAEDIKKVETKHKTQLKELEKDFKKNTEQLKELEKDFKKNTEQLKEKQRKEMSNLMKGKG